MRDTAAIKCWNPVLFGDGYPGHIYFIQMDRIGPIKIGYSTNVKTRHAALQYSCPYELHLIYSTPASPEDEQMVHEQLKKYHKDICLKGEWYLPAEVIFNTINDFIYIDEKEGLDDDKEDSP